jgi:glyoxylase-like metal-dependent hydrolase (beta-lactamase superfamily II)
MVRDYDGPMTLPGAEQLAPGLWRWVAYHPEWQQDVACVAYATGSTLALIDPMLPAERDEARRFLRALDREVRARPGPLHVLVTIHWHKRHAAEIVDRYAKKRGVELWGPSGATHKLDLRDKRKLDHVKRPPAGISAFETRDGDEVVLWLPRVKTLFAGDALLGGKRKPLRVCPQSWLPQGQTRVRVARSLRPLTKLPVKLIIPAHGAPVRENAAEALAAAIADAA